MRPDTLIHQVSDLVEPLVADRGLVCERVEVHPRGSRRVVLVTIDLADGPGSLGSDLLAEVSRDISAALDEADVIPGRYTLEVSTPGVGRPLTSPRHYRRAQGRLLKLRRRADAGAETDAGGETQTREIEGRVQGADEDAVQLRLATGEQVSVPYADIERATVEVELRRIEED